MIVDKDPFAPITEEMWERLRAAWPNAARLAFAFKLAPDLETCRALLAGEPVDPALLDQAELERVKTLQLVRFDRAMLDVYDRLFTIRPAA